jgi:hypothetical protein
MTPSARGHCIPRSNRPTRTTGSRAAGVHEGLGREGVDSRVDASHRMDTWGDTAQPASRKSGAPDRGVTTRRPVVVPLFTTSYVVGSRIPRTPSGSVRRERLSSRARRRSNAKRVVASESGLSDAKRVVASESGLSDAKRVVASQIGQSGAKRVVASESGLSGASVSSRP